MRRLTNLALTRSAFETNCSFFFTINRIFIWIIKENNNLLDIYKLISGIANVTKIILNIGFLSHIHNNMYIFFYFLYNTEAYTSKQNNSNINLKCQTLLFYAIYITKLILSVFIFFFLLRTTYDRNIIT